jgi:uncharacterized protein (TIRG00374 family)
VSDEPGPTPDTPAPGRRSAAARLWWRLRRCWPWVRYVVGLGLAALAVWALLGRRGELSGASTYLAHTEVAWVVMGVLLELASIVAFALVQQELLAAGEVRVTAGWITGVTLAVTAISNSMPAGPLVSSVFAFRQYRRRGADDTLAGWALAAVFVAASVTLALVATAGLAVAGAEGASLDLVGVTVAVLIVAVLLGVVFVQRRALQWTIRAGLRLTRRILHWPRGEVDAQVETIIARIDAVAMTRGRVLRIMGWGVANWLLDCGCLAVCFTAVGVAVPWHGLLLAYGAGQLAVNLPITPGGLGVVEGSLTIALVAFGGAEASTVAAVLLYRIISFWGELPVGWSIWAGFAWRSRRERAGTAAAEGHDVAQVMA